LNLTGLAQLISQTAAVRQLREDLRSSRIFGLLNAARPAVVAALLEGRQESAVMVTAHAQEAQELAEELQHWSGRRVAHFPALESLPYERVHPDRALIAAREAVAQGVVRRDVELVVAPVRALMQPVQVSGGQVHEPQPVRVGDRVIVDRLLKTWGEGGYSEVALVEEPGTFARRGGVVDIFPAGAETPCRLELFGNEIDSLRTFDPATQRSIGAATELRVPPMAGMDEDARLAALDALIDVNTEGMNAQARTRWLDDLARLEAGASFDDLAVFGPYLSQQPLSLVDGLPASAVVVLDGAEQIRRTLDDLWQQAADVQQRLEESGDLPKGLRPALLPPQRVREALEKRVCLELEAGSGAGSEDRDWSGLFVPAQLYGGRLRNFSHDMASAGSNRTVIASLQHDRIGELLGEEGVPARQISELSTAPPAGVTIVPLSLAEGWVLGDAQLTLLTDHELFGRARIRPVPRKQRPVRETFFTDYSPGDYVVHVEHGIGRYAGITRMAVDGAEREYALVEYAGADRVYVPTDQLERLTRYVGVGDAPPTLNRLGGGEWQRARQRAERAAAEIARELVELYARRMSRPGHAFEPDQPWQRELESSFAYPETPDQLRAVEEVKRDMETAHPMDRLVCADVGYGKTEVAVRATFKAVMDGSQVAVLTPTTVLAQQHFETFSERFEAFPIKVEALSRFRSPAQQRDILRRLASGEVDVVIGTHRLLSKDVVFKSLGLLIVDEEQRFGVRHKEQLKKLRETVDVLTLTATPIPRTLHMGLVGIREISVIETPPEGRLPIKTYLQPFDERLVREAVLRELDRDGQVYIVHNKVATIEAMAERLRRLVPEAHIVVGHGQMDEAQLERVMLSFARHEADVLLCSTIIENGLDIPNVNTIVVNNAHRLGLTQLYQLRGRVGRSANQAYAYLLYPRDAQLTHDARRRMEAVFEAQELGAGFSIAMRDLEIRGAGNLLGAEQSGHAAAIGFDLYTRMIADAVERLQGVPVQEQTLVSLDLPLTMFLPPEYVGSEAERLSLYRRLAGVTDSGELDALREEIRDRFGPPPLQVESLFASVRLKLLAQQAKVTSISLGPEVLVVRAAASALYDRVSLYKRYGMEAKVSTNVLRIPRRVLPEEWMPAIEEILTDMIRLRSSIAKPEPVRA
jgi:transcription-repair coupling factor (superfamily II helicase)